MVNDQAAADDRAGVDLNTGPEPAPLGHKPGQEAELMAVKPVGDVVVDNGVYAGVEQENLQLSACGGIPPLVCAKGL